ncbi:helix-turn-helix domain-containing protein [Ktedonosporobacter rubrisoli]|uniref:Helix-turn-helix domain-containing protein n=1 Tax=Ktedonosporobacter rubrisoli TaxID=2509675 RepID=A0A4P6K496_KTERU|nr:FxSxx-COOH system tetratricopeptide repeat protein [Ktedonosporobacter rubrisoli]QBD82875.1 helix-turn-helix domain-containing protein [Ktedonosporobacter rubrisoli]
MKDTTKDNHLASEARSFGQILRQHRIRLHLSQEALAEELGVTARSISRWEHDLSMPQHHYRERLSHLLKIEIPFLHGSFDTQLRPSPWNVPYPRNYFFTGREQVLRELHDAFTTQSLSVLALSGLAGIGKTQTAVEFAYRFRCRYSAVLWVRAETRFLLETDLTATAKLLNPLEEGAFDQQCILAFKRWLNEHKGWLLILDNVEEFSLVQDLLACAQTGSLLLTTQRQAVGTQAFSIELEPMEPDEATLFLLRRARLLAPNAPLAEATVEQCRTARTLAQQMDGLPLALDQIGAYLEETGGTLSNYLYCYQQQQGVLLNRRGGLGSDHPRSLMATLALTLQQIERLQPAAAHLLRLCSLLHPDSIPEELFTQEVLGPCAAALPGARSSLLVDEACAVLRQYSLLKRHPDTRTLTVHRLVQIVLKEQMEQSTYQLLARQAVYAVNRLFPSVEELTTWPRCQQLLPQALQCAELIIHERLVSVEAARLLQQTGIYLLECASYSQAEGYLQHALVLYLQLFGPEHPTVAESLNSLAELCYFRGRYKQAEPLYQRSLDIRLQQFGNDHPDVANSLNNLAGLFYALGRYKQAEPLYQQALSIRERLLGPEHLDVAETLQNLAYLYYVQGNYKQAEPLYQRAFIILKQVLGHEHAYLVTIYNNLGRLYQAKGSCSQAEAFYQRALALCKKKLGPQHPHRALTYHNLAELSCARREYEQAERFYRLALHLRQQVLGPEHPRTAQSLHDLAVLCSLQGRETQAEDFYLQALRIRETTLGPDHPDLALTIEAYVCLLAQQGREREAGPLRMRAQAIRVRCAERKHCSLP